MTLPTAATPRGFLSGDDSPTGTRLQVKSHLPALYVGLGLFGLLVVGMCVFGYLLSRGL